MTFSELIELIGSMRETKYGTMNDDNINGNNISGKIIGYFGNDVIHGNGGNDTIYGGFEYSWLSQFVNDGDDTVYGGSGNDKIYGGSGNDTLYGDSGNDTIHAGHDDDYIAGDEGTDSLLGGLGNDRIFGGAGDDQIHGGDGNDVLGGGDGDNILFGGQGHDIFVLDGDDTNLVRDFDSGVDKVRIDVERGVSFYDLVYGTDGSHFPRLILQQGAQAQRFEDEYNKTVFLNGSGIIYQTLEGEVLGTMFLEGVYELNEASFEFV